MALSIEDDVEAPDLAVVVRIAMLIISVIFGLFRAKLETLLRGRPEHMEILQNVYRDLSVGAMISLFLSMVESSTIALHGSGWLGIKEETPLADALHSLHLLFLMGVFLYMSMCTTIMCLLGMAVTSIKNWDAETIDTGVKEMLLEIMRASAASPGLLTSLHIMYAKRKLAFLMYREVFLMQFVSDSEESPQDFSYVRYLRLAIYKVGLQLTKIRSTAGILIVIIIVARWTCVRFLDLNINAGFYSAVSWTTLSFLYFWHVDSRIRNMCQEYLIDSRKFTQKNLQDFQERVERFGLQETQQVHDTDSPKIVVKRAQESQSKIKRENLSRSVLDAWAQHRALRKRQIDELVNVAALKFKTLAGLKITYKSNQIAPNPTAVGDEAAVSGNHAGPWMNEDGFRKIHRIADKFTILHNQISRHYFVDPSRTMVGSDENLTEEYSLDRASSLESRATPRNQDQQTPRVNDGRPNQHVSDTDHQRRLYQSLSSNITPRHTSLPDSQHLMPQRSYDSLVHLPVELDGQDLKLGRSVPASPRVSMLAANPNHYICSRSSNEISRPASLTSDNENSVSYSGTPRKNLLSRHIDGVIESKNDRPSKRESTHQHGHHGFRQSVRKSLKTPADEIAKKNELDRRRSTPLKDHMSTTTQSNRGIGHKRHLYTYRLIASFGGCKLEQAHSHDLEKSFRWWASPGAEGLISILHYIVLIDAFVFGLAAYLIANDGSLQFIAIMIPVVLKLLLVPLLIQDYTIITSSGSMARIELLLLAIHQNLEEEMIAQIN